ncbi:hypothetical protein [Frankia gtarii]|uniref:hypothetical protein n=1 Tax=Frankia gtarii TaxID=2950102 RepID=UPI0021C0179B|nr:hypothetical protein [Frankia gtarii]
MAARIAALDDLLGLTDLVIFPVMPGDLDDRAREQMERFVRDVVPLVPAAAVTPRGYAPSFPGGVVAALLGRQRELSGYRTPVAGLSFTGAGTFPGAGAWGAGGRNTAEVILAPRRGRAR